MLARLAAVQVGAEVELLARRRASCLSFNVLEHKFVKMLGVILLARRRSSCLQSFKSLHQLQTSIRKMGMVFNTALKGKKNVINIYYLELQ